jgi:hypothetical protein
VVLAEASKKARMDVDAAAFAYDQQFAFSWLLPLAMLAVVVSVAGNASTYARR